jgi:hypothetical protein
MTEDIKVRKLPPVWFIRIIEGFRKFLLRLHNRMYPANVVLYEHFQYFWLLPCLKVAAELDIAGILKDGPKTIDELAAITRSHTISLFRLMRALSGKGIFRLRKDGRYINTPMSRPLIDGKDSLRHMILQHLGKLNWTIFSELSYSVKTGEDAFTKVYGKFIYDYLAEHPDESELFDKSMTNLTEIAIEPILSVYDFSEFGKVADIGGGEGFLLANVLYKHKNLQGILFDLPEGLNNAPAMLEKYGISERVSVITGNFLETIPAGADAYMLKNIVHNWSDADCVRILSNIHKVLPEKGKILIIEMVLQEDNKPSFGKLIDIQMLVFMHAGRERTRKEFENVLIASGLRINRVVPTIAPFSVIEAGKA